MPSGVTPRRRLRPSTHDLSVAFNLVIPGLEDGPPDTVTSMTLRLHDDEVHLIPYSPTWADAGAAECRRLLTAVGRWTSRVEHVGSTAVPGLAAKPVIDICLGVHDLLQAEDMTEDMAGLGYDYPGDVGIPDDRVFGREPGWRTHLVHVVVVDGPRWNAYLRFRDSLRADPGLRDEYETLKRVLAASHAADRHTYTQHKTSFVERVLGDSADQTSVD